MPNIIISTNQKKQVVNITEIVNRHVRQSGMVTGICHLFVKHTTAALTTADLDPGTDLDMLDAFDRLVPKLDFRHPHNPAHVPDHIVSSLIGPDVTVPVKDGGLDLGTWQEVVLVELDGPREREIVISLT